MTTQDKVGAYSTQQRQATTGREIDKRALLNCASRLKDALDDDGKDIKLYADAIRHNQRLWTIFQVALCDPENKLPRDLKAILLSLSRYVDRVSFQAIGGFMPDILASLIDINRNIAAGLGKNPPAQETTMPPEQMALMDQPVVVATTA